MEAHVQAPPKELGGSVEIGSGGEFGSGPSAPPSLPPLSPESPRCSLLGGDIGVLVQVILGLAFVFALFFKRWREKPRRPMLVWAFDASKQGVSGFLQHFINVGIGVVFAEEGQASECSWYFVSFVISVAFGIVFLAAFVWAYRKIVERYKLTLLKTGEYGSPPRWKAFFAQMSIWCVVACLEKALTAVVVIYPFRKHLDALAIWIEQPVPKTRAGADMELIFVMVAAPTFLNVGFALIIDNLIMRRSHGMRFRQFKELPSPNQSPGGRLSDLPEHEMSHAFMTSDSMVPSPVMLSNGVPAEYTGGVQPLVSTPLSRSWV
jgi:hypothetical protein